MSSKSCRADCRATLRLRKADGLNPSVCRLSRFVLEVGGLTAGHYTTAIIHDRRDAIPFSNRAAAYLKLDK